MRKVGLLGVGFMGTTHLRYWLKQEGFEIGAICSPSRRGFDGDFSSVVGNIGGSGTKMSMKGITCYTDAEDLFADPKIDIVDDCTPTEYRLGNILSAMMAGKHLLFEKPLAVPGNSVRGVLRMRAKYPTPAIMPACCIRFWAEYAYLLETVKKGFLGKLLSLKLIREGEMPMWAAHFANGVKSGGGVVDLLWHDFDIAMAIQDTWPDSITAQGFIGPSGAVDSCTAKLVWKSGPTIEVDGGWRENTPFRMEFHAEFEEGSLDYENGVLLSNTDQVQCGSKDGWELMIEHFADSVRTNTHPKVGLTEAWRTWILIGDVLKTIRRTHPQRASVESH